MPTRIFRLQISSDGITTSTVEHFHSKSISLKVDQKCSFVVCIQEYEVNRLTSCLGLHHFPSMIHP